MTTMLTIFLAWGGNFAIIATFILLGLLFIYLWSCLWGLLVALLFINKGIIQTDRKFTAK